MSTGEKRELRVAPDELKQAYREMADLTNPACKGCMIPFSCCHETYCNTTIEYAKTRYGIDLPHDPTAKLPLLGPSGCTAEPYLRPMCTVHTCDVLTWGHGDTREWTETYFDLRDRISRMEFELGL
jgi:hypothetical protein